jgi:hypothetical protein
MKPNAGMRQGARCLPYTEAARYYAQWDRVEQLLPEPLITFAGRSAFDGFYPYKPFTFTSAPSETPILDCRTVFYTPPVSASPNRIESQVLALFAAFSYLVEAANQRNLGERDFLVTRRTSAFIELLIVDEANRRKATQGWSKSAICMIKGGSAYCRLRMPGLDKRLMRAPQLYSRIGFAHHMEPMSEEETRDFLEKRWNHRGKRVFR